MIEELQNTVRYSHKTLQSHSHKIDSKFFCGTQFFVYSVLLSTRCMLTTNEITFSLIFKGQLLNLINKAIKVVNEENHLLFNRLNQYF